MTIAEIRAELDRLDALRGAIVIGNLYNPAAETAFAVAIDEQYETLADMLRKALAVVEAARPAVGIYRNPNSSLSIALTAFGESADVQCAAEVAANEQRLEAERIAQQIGELEPGCEPASEPAHEPTTGDE